MTDEAGPFHAGERSLHARHGIEGRMAETGRRAIRDHMIDQHRAFYGLLPWLLLVAADAEGRPWPTVLAGEPGFLDAADPRRLVVRALPRPDDPAAAGIADGRPVGLLGLQPHTRRRNRLNGLVWNRGDDRFSVGVVQSFGNCPKYIQARLWHRPDGPPPAPAPAVRAAGLTAADRALITAADTVFVASRAADERHGLDVSHRGGRPGFVRLEDDATLLWPDYPGNYFFQTLGNLLTDPRCGLAVVDWDTGDLLQLAGTAQVVEDPPAFAGNDAIERAVRFRVEEAVRQPALLPWRWTVQEASPFNGAVEPA